MEEDTAAHEPKRARVSAADVAPGESTGQNLAVSVGSAAGVADVDAAATPSTTPQRPTAPDVPVRVSRRLHLKRLRRQADREREREREREEEDDKAQASAVAATRVRRRSTARTSRRAAAVKARPRPRRPAVTLPDGIRNCLFSATALSDCAGRASCDTAYEGFRRIVEGLSPAALAAATASREATAEQLVLPILNGVLSFSGRVFAGDDGPGTAPGFLLSRSGAASGARSVGSARLADDEVLAVVVVAQLNSRLCEHASRAVRRLHGTAVRWAVLTDGAAWRLFHCEGHERARAHRFFHVRLFDFDRAGGAVALSPVASDPASFRWFPFVMGRGAYEGRAPLGSPASAGAGAAATDSGTLPLLEAIAKRSREHVTLMRRRVLRASVGALEALVLAFQRSAPPSAALATHVDHGSLVVLRIMYILMAEARGILPLDVPAYWDLSLTKLVVHLSRDPLSRLPCATSTWAYLHRLFVLVHNGTGAATPSRGDGSGAGDTFEPRLPPFALAAHRTSMFAALAPWQTEGSAEFGALTATSMGATHAGDSQHPIAAKTTEDLLRDVVLALGTAWSHTASAVTLKRGRGEASTTEGMEVIDYGVFEPRDIGAMYEVLLGVSDSFSAVSSAQPSAGCAGAGAARSSLMASVLSRLEKSSYFTPDWAVCRLVRSALRSAVSSATDRAVSGRRSVVDELLRLRILDPAMGSGHFLVDAAVGLADAVCDAAVREGDSRYADLTAARCAVVKRCIFGVDRNPVAVSLARCALVLCCHANRSDVSAIQRRRSDAGGALDAAGAHRLQVELADVFVMADVNLRCGDSLIGCVDSGDIACGGRTLRSNLDEVMGEFVGALSEYTTPPRPGSRVSTTTRDAPGSAAAPTLSAAQRAVRRLREWRDSGVVQTVEALAEVRLDGRLGFGSRLDKMTASAASDAIEARLRSEPTGFHWFLEFPAAVEGVEASVSPRFDVILMNPPWDVLQQMVARQKYAGPAQRYDKQQSVKGHVRSVVLESGLFPHSPAFNKPNLAAVFTERALRLLRSGGQLALVAPSSFLSSNSSRNVRAHFFRTVALSSVFEFGKKVLFNRIDGLGSEVNKPCFMALCSKEREREPHSRAKTLYNYIGSYDEFKALQDAEFDYGGRAATDDEFDMLSPRHMPRVAYVSEQDYFIALGSRMPGQLRSLIELVYPPLHGPGGASASLRAATELASTFVRYGDIARVAVGVLPVHVKQFASDGGGRGIVSAPSFARYGFTAKLQVTFVEASALRTNFKTGAINWAERSEPRVLMRETVDFRSERRFQATVSAEYVSTNASTIHEFSDDSLLRIRALEGSSVEYGSLAAHFCCVLMNSCVLEWLYRVFERTDHQNTKMLQQLPVPRSVVEATEAPLPAREWHAIRTRLNRPCASFEALWVEFVSGVPTGRLVQLAAHLGVYLHSTPAPARAEAERVADMAVCALFGLGVDEARYLMGDVPGSAWHNGFWAKPAGSDVGARAPPAAATERKDTGSVALTERSHAAARNAREQREQIAATAGAR